MIKHIAVVIFVIATLGNVSAQDTGFEPLAELPKENFRGDPPSQTRIEAAYRECLKQIDSETADIKSGNAIKQSHIKGEAAICERNRKGCVTNPKSVDCRAFVDDYSDSGTN